MCSEAPQLSVSTNTPGAFFSVVSCLVHHLQVRALEGALLEKNRAVEEHLTAEHERILAAERADCTVRLVAQKQALDAERRAERGLRESAETEAAALRAELVAAAAARRTAVARAIVGPSPAALRRRALATSAGRLADALGRWRSHAKDSRCGPPQHPTSCCSGHKRLSSLRCGTPCRFAGLWAVHAVLVDRLRARRGVARDEAHSAIEDTASAAHSASPPRRSGRELFASGGGAEDEDWVDSVRVEHGGSGSEDAPARVQRHSPRCLSSGMPAAPRRLCRLHPDRCCALGAGCR